MYFQTVGLVLRETQYKDADKLLTVLTKDRGKLTLRARGVRSKNSRLKSGCQLLAYSEFTVFENKSFYLIEEAVPIQLFLPLREDIEKLSLASYFAQVSEVISQEDSPSPELLSLCLNAMYALSQLDRPQKLVKAAFELRAASLAGQLLQNVGEFLPVHRPGRPAVAVAKAAVQIANIGDFNIRPGIHSPPSFLGFIIPPFLR